MQPEFSESTPAETVPVTVSQTPVADTTEVPEASPSGEDYVFVKMPNGAVVPVLKSEIHETPTTVSQDRPAKFSEPVPEEQFYVHLANGEVLRVNQSDLPEGTSTNAPMGHWQQGNKVHTVVGVYPVETIVK